MLHIFEQGQRLRGGTRALAIVATFAIVAGGIGDVSGAQHGRLIAYEPFAATGEMCMMPAEWQREELRAMRQGAGGGSGRALPANLPESTYKEQLRRIRDEYPTFASVSVDTERNEVVFTDESTFKILVYDRMENTPAGLEASRPRRTIAGDKTDIEFQSGVYVDPKTGEIWAANNDTRDRFIVFAAGADGDVAPLRTAETPHGTFGLVMDDAHGEALFTVQHDSAIVTYRQNADGDDSPIRMMQGDRTGIQDPHGIALDPRDDVIFVANFGSTHDVDGSIKPREGVPSEGNDEGKRNWPLGREFAIPGSGAINEPSIIVHRRAASGNVSPLRVIKGQKTQLNWPTGVSFDPRARELFVANDAAHSVLVFDAAASGDVAPKRVIRGPKTKLANPTGIFADVKNRELWITNFGGHSATVYDMAASGDVAPKRIIRNAPEGTPSLMIGNPGTLGYDTKRERIIVPNCVAHPQIAMFTRLANGQAQRLGAIEGQKTLLGRTMHGMGYDAVRDEIVVPQQFGQGILVFRASANGEEPPIRVIRGPRTRLIALDRVAVDDVNGEYYVPEGGEVLVFSRDANGNVEPSRVLSGPSTGFSAARAIAVDTTRNLLIVVGSGRGRVAGRQISIFDRKASGDARPLRVVTGLATSENVTVEPERGLVFVVQHGDNTGYVGVWSVADSGNVPPRYVIGGPNGTLFDPRGVVLDAKNRAVLVSDKQLNAVLTYHVPAIFDAPAIARQALP